VGFNYNRTSLSPSQPHLTLNSHHGQIILFRKSTSGPKIQAIIPHPSNSLKRCRLNARAESRIHSTLTTLYPPRSNTSFHFQSNGPNRYLDNFPFLSAVTTILRIAHGVGVFHWPHYRLHDQGHQATRSSGCLAPAHSFLLLRWDLTDLVTVELVLSIYLLLKRVFSS